ncbi:hypothetical protein D3C78_1499570 [compost metagenome]
MCSRAALPSGVSAAMVAMISYQAPASALPKAGLSLRVALLTTIRSMISPGIWLESNTLETPGVAATSASSGFQVVTALTSSLAKAATRSASEVLITLRSFSLRPARSKPRASR